MSMNDKNNVVGKVSCPKRYRGYSAYEIAVIKGYKGTEEDFIRQYTENKEYTDKEIAAVKKYYGKPLPLENGTSEKSLQMKNNTVGLKGFYWKSIEGSGMDAKITLSTKNGDFGEETDFDIRNYWAVGDKITIHSDQHHIDCATIEYFDGKDVMYVTMLSFTPTNESAHHTDQAIYVLSKPENGLVDFGQNSVAFGEYCKALGYCNFTAGVDCEALDQYGAVFGNYNKVGYASGAFGKENEALGMAALVAGGKSKANGKLAISLGRHLNVEGEYNFAANSANKVYGRANAALNGSEEEFPNDDTTDGNKVYGKCNLAIGNNNAAHGTSSYAFVGGQNSSVSGNASYAFGIDCYASGMAAHAHGYDNAATGSTSYAGGARCTASGSGSFAHGDSLNATARVQAVFGQYNATNANALFQIGNGSSDTARSNAFEVLSNGIKIGNTTITEAQLIKLLALLS